MKKTKKLLTLGLSSVIGFGAIATGVVIGSTNIIQNSKVNSTVGDNSNTGSDINTPSVPESDNNIQKEEHWWLSKTDKEYINKFKRAFETNDLTNIAKLLNDSKLNTYSSSEKLVNTFFKTSENITNPAINKADYIANKDILDLTFTNEFGIKVRLSDNAKTNLYYTYDKEQTTIKNVSKDITFNFNLNGKKIYFYDKDLLPEDFNGNFQIDEDLSAYSLVAGISKSKSGEYKLHISPRVITKDWKFQYLGSRVNVYSNNQYIKQITDFNWTFNIELNLTNTDNPASGNNNLVKIQESELLKKYDNLLSTSSTTVTESFNQLFADILTKNYSNENRKAFASDVIRTNFKLADDFTGTKPFSDLVKAEDILGVDSVQSTNSDIVMQVKFANKFNEFKHVMAVRENNQWHGVPLRSSMLKTTIKTNNKPFLFLNDKIYSSKYDMKYHVVNNPTNYSAIVGIYKEDGQYKLHITNTYTNTEGQFAKFDSTIEYDTISITNSQVTVFNNIDITVPLNYSVINNQDITSGNKVIDFAKVMNSDISLESKALWLNKEYKKLDAESQKAAALSILKTKFGTLEDKTKENVYEATGTTGFKCIVINNSLISDNDVLGLENITFDGSTGFIFNIKLAKNNGAVINKTLTGFGMAKNQHLGNFISGDTLSISINLWNNEKGIYFEDKEFNSTEEFYSHAETVSSKKADIIFGMIKGSNGKYNLSVYSNNCRVSANNFGLGNGQHNGIKIDSLLANI